MVHSTSSWFSLAPPTPLLRKRGVSNIVHLAVLLVDFNKYLYAVYKRHFVSLDIIYTLLIALELCFLASLLDL